MYRKGEVISCFGVSELYHKIVGRRRMMLLEERKRGNRITMPSNEHSVVMKF